MDVSLETVEAWAEIAGAAGGASPDHGSGPTIGSSSYSRMWSSEMALATIASSGTILQRIGRPR